MLNSKGLVTAFIVVLVVGIAAWSKLRYLDDPVYDRPQRWQADAHPAFRR
jgi:hypothetical protein